MVERFEEYEENIRADNHFDKNRLKLYMLEIYKMLGKRMASYSTEK
jgi:hypothetical protein